MKTIKIKDILWNGGYPMMRYKVTAEIKRDKNTQWELSCLDCNHSGGNCRILITKDDNKKYSYVGMVSEDPEEDISEKHYYFHKNNGSFYLTKEEAEIEKVEKYITDCLVEIEKHKKGIEYQENRLKEYRDRLTAYKDLLSTPVGNEEKI